MIREDAVCLTCKYPLKKLRHHECPECGRNFDPRDRRSYGPRPQPPAMDLTALPVVSASFVGVVILFYTWASTPRPGCECCGWSIYSQYLFGLLLRGIISVLVVFAFAAICRHTARRG